LQFIDRQLVICNKRLWVLKIFILPPSFSLRLGFSAPNLQFWMTILEQNKKFSDSQNLGEELIVTQLLPLRQCMPLLFPTVTL